MFSAAKEGLCDGNEQPSGYSLLVKEYGGLLSHPRGCRVIRSTGDPQKRRKWTIRVATAKRYAQRRGTRGRGKDQRRSCAIAFRINLPRKTLTL